MAQNTDNKSAKNYTTASIWQEIITAAQKWHMLDELSKNRGLVKRQQIINKKAALEQLYSHKPLSLGD